MPETNTDATLKELLNNIKNNSDNCGFEGFAVMRSDPKLKKLSFDEGKVDCKNNYKTTIKNMIIGAIVEKYLAESAEYVSGEYIANNQKKFYIIPMSESYAPFKYLDDSVQIPFEFKDLNNVSGIVFCLRYKGKIIWAYQHLWSIMIPNKKRNNLIARLFKYENVEILAEQKEPLLIIAKKVDLLIADGDIITSNISLMQSSFEFHNYIQTTANISISKIKEKGIIKDQNKLEQYILRGKPKYAKKMMRIANSKVFSLTNDQLLEKIRTVPRWKDKFDIVNGLIQLNTYEQVEKLIDLFDERYTKSEITDQEYDTDVKQLAEPVNHNKDKMN